MAIGLSRQGSLAAIDLLYITNRQLHSTARLTSSPIAGPSSLRARPPRYRVRATAPSVPHPRHHARRHFSSSSAITPILDTLGTALKFPINVVTEAILHTPLPSYGLTIILLAVALRSTLTVPISIWQRNQNYRRETLVRPELFEYNEAIKEPLVRQAKLEGKNYEEYEKLWRKHRDAKTKELNKRYGVRSTGVVNYGPMAINIPLIITASMAVRQTLLIPDSPVGSEQFLWMANMSEPDMALTLGVGMISWGLSEFVSARKPAREIRNGIAKELGVKLDKTGLALAPSGTARSKRTILSGQLATPVTKTTTIPGTPPPSPRTLSPPLPPPSTLSPPASSASLPPRHSSSTKRASTLKPRSRSFSSSPTILVSPSPKVQLSSSPSLAAKATQVSRPGLKRPLSASEEEARRKAASPEAQDQLKRDAVVWVFRGASILVFFTAMNTPAAIILYWCTSLSFTMAQMFAFQHLDVKRYREEILRLKREST